MGGFRIRLSDTGLKQKLARLSALDAQDAVTATANTVAKGAQKYTPRRSGELVVSLFQRVTRERATVGYTAEYAPHVEYGHRTRGGGYVPGQHFFRRAADDGRKVFKQIVRDAVEEAIR